MEFWSTVFEEMTKGNFSFAILVVGAAQLQKVKNIEFMMNDIVQESNIIGLQ